MEVPDSVWLSVKNSLLLWAARSEYVASPERAQHLDLPYKPQRVFRSSPEPVPHLILKSAIQSYLWNLHNSTRCACWWPKIILSISNWYLKYLIYWAMKLRWQRTERKPWIWLPAGRST